MLYWNKVFKIYTLYFWIWVVSTCRWTQPHMLNSHMQLDTYINPLVESACMNVTAFGFPKHENYYNFLKSKFNRLWGTCISHQPFPQRLFPIFIWRLIQLLEMNQPGYDDDLIKRQRVHSNIVRSPKVLTHIYLPRALNTAPLPQINRLLWHYSSGTYRSVNVCIVLRQVRATFTRRFGSVHDLDLRA